MSSKLATYLGAAFFILAVYNHASGAIIATDTVAIYDAVSETGSPISSYSTPDHILGTFRSLSSLQTASSSINNFGHITFDIGITIGARTSNVLVTTDLQSGILTTVPRMGGGIPGEPVITNDGAIVALSPGAGEIFITDSDGTVSFIAQDNANIGTTGFTFGSTTFLGPIVDAQAPAASTSHVVFQAVATDDRYHCTRPSVCYSGDSEYATIKYTRATGHYEVLIREPENPQTQSGRFVENIEHVDVNDHGTLAFMGRYNPPGDNPPGFSGLYPADTVWAIAVGNSLASARIVAQGGMIAPGTGGQTYETGIAAGIQTTPGPALNNYNQVAFRAPITGGLPNMIADALFYDDGNFTRLLAKWGDPTVNGGIYGRLGNVQLSDIGRVAFTAGLSIDSLASDEALYFTKRDGTPLRVLMRGDSISVELPDGTHDSKEILAIQLSRERQGSYNSSGELVFGVRFTDGSHAMLMFDQNTLKEAAGIVMGDFNGDGIANLLDIDSFVLALTDPIKYINLYPGIDPIEIGDYTLDDNLNLLDIDGFLHNLSNNIYSIPEPSTIMYFVLSGVALIRRK